MSKEQLMANVVRAALVQATWTGDTESMVAK
ncbi:acyltransferase, partial [Streptomyces sp. SID5910]|nr:acyltransferase [Streptomyces sp. SID5910]